MKLSQFPHLLEGCNSAFNFGVVLGITLVGLGRDQLGWGNFGSALGRLWGVILDGFGQGQFWRSLGWLWLGPSFPRAAPLKQMALSIFVKTNPFFLQAFPFYMFIWLYFTITYLLTFSFLRFRHKLDPLCVSVCGRGKWVGEGNKFKSDPSMVLSSSEKGKLE